MILAIAVSRKWVRQGPDYNDLKSNGKADYLEVTEREREWWCLRSQSGEVLLVCLLFFILSCREDFNFFWGVREELERLKGKGIEQNP